MPEIDLRKLFPEEPKKELVPEFNPSEVIASEMFDMLKHGDIDEDTFRKAMGWKKDKKPEEYSEEDMIAENEMEEAEAQP